MTGIVRGSLTDRDGYWDIAYVSLAGVAVATVGPIVVMTIMSVVASFRCTPAVYIVKDVLTVISCPYDPQPLGNAIGFACGGFGVALGALAAYMAATRRPQGSSTTTTHTEERVVAPPPAPIPAPLVESGETLKVDVVHLPQESKGETDGSKTEAKPTKRSTRGGKTKH